jgi:hypothetical protein
LPQFMRQWHDKLTGQCGLRYRLSLRKAQPIDLAQKVVEFRQYMSEGYFEPYYLTNKNWKLVEVDVPQIHMVASELMEKWHIPESEVLNRPWYQCLRDVQLIKLKEGKIDPANREEIKEAQESGDRVMQMLKEGKICQS